MVGEKEQDIKWQMFQVSGVRCTEDIKFWVKKNTS